MKAKLYINLYEAGVPTRDGEILFCFMENSRRGHFDDIVNVPGRPTFNEMFRATQEHGEGCINVIANTDIYFDGTIGLVRDYYAKGAHPKTCMALSRWDVTDTKTHEAALWEHKDSQDVWIFPGQVDEIEGADFTLGIPGCDNRIARLLKDAGWEVINPCRDVKAYHLHLSGVRSYGDGRGKAKKYTVPGPYAFVEPGTL